MTSHELRTPMQRLCFGVERARDARSEEDRERALDRMDKDLAELDQLVDELLTYVRLKERRAPVRAPVDLRPVVEEVCEKLTDMAAGTAVVAPAPALEPLPVEVEARLIRRALSNL